MRNADEVHLRHAFALARRARAAGEWPFGAVVAREGQILSEAEDACVRRIDPTAHAEVEAIRAACGSLGSLDLAGATLYASAEPCLLCCGAIHWSGIRRVVFGLSQGRLNALSGGRKKPGCETLLSHGKAGVEILGGLLVDEALAPFEGFPFPRKSSLLGRP